MFSDRFKTFNSRLRSSGDQANERDASIPGASMKILPPRALQATQAAQQEDTTSDFEAGMEQRGHRRMTITIERETLSVLMRRTGPAQTEQSTLPPQNNAANNQDK
jgi:hypothetical protein